MPAYYNDRDPFCADWLRNLIAAGELPAGEVDARPIEDVSGDDLRGFNPVHLFAGIGGWALATRFVRWPDERELFTGSCPCQPYSTAGRGLGDDDPRALWPEFRRLVGECRPANVVGEQVASAAGRAWLDRVRVDLEAMGYGVGAADLCAASVGAPHARQRLWFVASRGRLVDAPTPGLPGQPFGLLGAGGHTDGQECATPWDRCEWQTCADGRTRRFKPGVRVLANGVPARVGKLRSIGNAVVPQLAAVILDCALAEGEA